MDKKRGGELCEWRKGGREGVVKEGGGSRVFKEKNRLVTGSNVPSKTVDTLQYSYTTCLKGHIEIVSHFSLFSRKFQDA